jgi:hypothetical protein
VLYVVEPGDTLLGIAARFNVTANEIQLANPDLRPQFLQIGQRVIIPIGGGADLTGALMPTPTPLPLNLVAFALYETPVGGLLGLGEVANDTGGPAENVQIVVMLYNAAGELQASLETWAARDIIPDGETAPFGVLFSDPPADVGGHQIAIVTGERVFHIEERFADLELISHQGGPAGALFRVTGTVFNAGETTAQDVTLTVTLYDAGDQVTGFRQSALPDPLFPGQIAPFDIRLSPGGPSAERYTLVADGRQAISTE